MKAHHIERSEEGSHGIFIIRRLMLTLSGYGLLVVCSSFFSPTFSIGARRPRDHDSGDQATTTEVERIASAWGPRSTLSPSIWRHGLRRVASNLGNSLFSRAIGSSSSSHSAFADPVADDPDLLICRTSIAVPLGLSQRPSKAVGYRSRVSSPRSWAFATSFVLATAAPMSSLWSWLVSRPGLSPSSAGFGGPLVIHHHRPIRSRACAGRPYAPPPGRHVLQPRPSRPSWSGSPSRPIACCMSAYHPMRVKGRHPWLSWAAAIGPSHLSRTCCPAFSRSRVRKAPAGNPVVLEQVQPRALAGGPTPDFRPTLRREHLHRPHSTLAYRGGHRLAAEPRSGSGQTRRSARHYSTFDCNRLTASSAARCWRSRNQRPNPAYARGKLTASLIAGAEFETIPTSAHSCLGRYPRPGCNATRCSPLFLPDRRLGLGAPRPAREPRATARRSALSLSPIGLATGRPRIRHRPRVAKLHPGLAIELGWRRTPGTRLLEAIGEARPYPLVRPARAAKPAISSLSGRATISTPSRRSAACEVLIQDFIASRMPSDQGRLRPGVSTTRPVTIDHYWHELLAQEAKPRLFPPTRGLVPMPDGLRARGLPAAD